MAMAMAMAMAIISNSTPLIQPPNRPIFRRSSPVTLSSPSSRAITIFPRLSALRTGSDGEKLRNRDVYGGDLLRKPVVHTEKVAVDVPEKIFSRFPDEGEGKGRFEEKDDDEGWVDWEDKILEDTVPLVGFVRMILHSGKYESGDRLSPAHEKTITERLLQYHPGKEKKIGPGIDYITIGYHPEFEGSRCLFIVRKDGELVDFSYWKCIKGLIRTKYPLHADGFILRHFQRRSKRG